MLLGSNLSDDTSSAVSDDTSSAVSDDVMRSDITITSPLTVLAPDLNVLVTSEDLGGFIPGDVVRLTIRVTVSGRGCCQGNGKWEGGVIGVRVGGRGVLSGRQGNSKWGEGVVRVRVGGM